MWINRQSQMRNWDFLPSVPFPKVGGHIWVFVNRYKGSYIELDILLIVTAGSTLCKYTGTHLSFMQFFRTKDKSYAMSGFGWALDAKPHPYVAARSPCSTHSGLYLTALTVLSLSLPLFVSFFALFCFVCLFCLYVCVCVCVCVCACVLS